MQWVGQCPSCKAWNTLEAFTVRPNTPSERRQRAALKPVEAKPLADVEVLELGRTPTGDVELDRVLGQGVVPGAVVLLGGEPGIGKSTLMLQSVLHMAAHSQRILYVAGEESPEQVRMRAERLGAVPPSLFVFPVHRHRPANS